MARSNQISEAEAIVQSERAAVKVCEEELRALRRQVISVERKMAEKQARLTVAEKMLAIFSPETGGSQPNKATAKRRMRLGAKKRAVYTLVAKQVSTLKEIETHLTVLNDTDIDKRHIRELIRSALADGDMQGEIEHQFILTDFGRELLEKSPIPSDWGKYRDAAEMRHGTRGLPSAAPKENEPPKGGSETEDVSASSYRSGEDLI